MAQMGGISSCNHCSQFRVTDRMKFSNSHHGAKQRRKQTTNATQPSHYNPPQNPPQPPYDYLSVHPFKIKYSDGQQKPYKPMRIPVVTQFFEKFCIPNDMDPTVLVISELFLPDLFLARVTKCLNFYGKAKGHSFKPIFAPNILVFFSIIYYMGIV